MAKFYSKLSENGKNLFILIAIALLGLLVLAPFFFFQNAGLGFGWILGSGIEIFCYLSILWSSKIISDVQAKHPGTIALAALFSILRIVLYAGGLFLGGLYTYKFHSNWLNLWTVFVAYLPMGFVLGINALIKAKKDKTSEGSEESSAKPEAPKADEIRPAQNQPVASEAEKKPVAPEAENKPVDSEEKH